MTDGGQILIIMHELWAINHYDMFSSINLKIRWTNTLICCIMYDVCTDVLATLDCTVAQRSHVLINLICASICVWYMSCRSYVIVAELQKTNICHHKINSNGNFLSYIWVNKAFLFAQCCFNLYPTRGGYLNFCPWFINNTLYERKKLKLWNKQHFMENKTKIMQKVLKVQ
jgi:hypothetical protein